MDAPIHFNCWPNIRFSSSTIRTNDPHNFYPIRVGSLAVAVLNTNSNIYERSGAWNKGFIHSFVQSFCALCSTFWQFYYNIIPQTVVKTHYYLPLYDCVFVHRIYSFLLLMLKCAFAFRSLCFSLSAAAAAVCVCVFCCYPSFCNYSRDFLHWGNNISLFHLI